ncbi:DUF4376 domain-containing protein [Arsukibacterium sp.]|uniref:DUF4376 domain-containing protein n=1 Tax=Arsukibacterium sp. TaxID=1977258 RepID=UPI00299E6269|nr:DUF4376 domain-containing protein [Arsukibacterium sp.]MDX1538816.1 DUF4376 domain-containing protein [Arsukibacterium sp.]
MIKWETVKTADDKLAEYIATKNQWLNTERDRLIAAGVDHAGYRYQTAERNIADLMGAIQVAQLAAAAGQQFTTQWLTEDNVTVPMNLQDLAALGAAVAHHKAALVYKCRDHKDAILALESKESIDNYILNITW